MSCGLQYITIWSLHKSDVASHENPTGTGEYRHVRHKSTATCKRPQRLTICSDGRGDCTGQPKSSKGIAKACDFEGYIRNSPKCYRALLRKYLITERSTVNGAPIARGGHSTHSILRVVCGMVMLRPRAEPYILAAADLWKRPIPGVCGHTLDRPTKCTHLSDGNCRGKQEPLRCSRLCSH